MSKVSIPTLIIAGAVVLILLICMCTYQVAFNEVAIKVRLGQADESSVIYGARDPGLKWRWPWPVESVQQYDNRLRTLDMPESESKTSDNKQVIVGTYAIWKIKDPLQFFVKVRTTDEAERQMRARISQTRLR